MSTEPRESVNAAGRVSGPARQRPANGQRAESGDEECRRLMEAYQAGDARAFEDLYALLAPQLRRYLLCLSGNATQAEDLLQESFLQIHRARATYRVDRPLRPWAFAIARYVARMELRARTRRRRHETRFPIVDLSLPGDIERLADRELIQSVLGSLGPDHREPLILHHAFGFSFREIGSLLGVRGNTAKVRAHRGLEQLRGRLKQETVDGRA